MVDPIAFLRDRLERAKRALKTLRELHARGLFVPAGAIDRLTESIAVYRQHLGFASIDKSATSYWNK